MTGKINLSTDGMASRKTNNGQERGPDGIDDRPTKRTRIEDEDSLDDEAENQSAPQVAQQASDLYLDTVRLGWSRHIHTHFHVSVDKSRKVGL